MAPWLLSALRLLGIALGTGAAFEAGSQLLEGPIDPRTGSPGLFGGIPFGIGQVLGGGHKPRRRRRRALTHQDKDDIAFLAATVGETTARKFALILAAHASR